MNLRSLKDLTRGMVATGMLISAATVTFGQSQNSVKKAEDPPAAKPAAVVPVKEEKPQAITPASDTGEKVSINIAETKPVIPVSESINEKAVAPKKQNNNSGWEVYNAPYLYMTGLNGTVGARGRTMEIDLSFGDIMSSFKVGLMGLFEFKKNKFVMTHDIMWLRLGEERTNQAPAPFLTSDVKVKQFTWDPEFGYRVAESEKGSFDVLGGFRLMSMENELNTTSGLLPGFNVSQRKTWATPVGGFRGRVNLSEKFFLSTKFDIGGGWGADFTTQIYAGAGYQINKKVAIVGGYRYLKTDYEDNTGFIFDTTMNGIVVGARIRMK